MDIEPTQQNHYPAKKARKSKHLGELNALLIRGLPDWVNDGGMLRTYDLAEAIGISYQAMYKIFSREKIPAKRIGALVKLSAETKNRPEDFQALTYEDFAEFLG